MERVQDTKRAIETEMVAEDAENNLKSLL